MENTFGIDLEFDLKYWTSGCISINFHNGFSLEIEFLCLGIYIYKLK